jgi:two-component system chemotaxis sensor kinase CheA
MARDPLKYFRIEARELLTQFGAAILDLEKSESAAAQTQRLLRLAHTLKGAARVVKESRIADKAHAIEDLLIPFRDATSAVPRDTIDVLLKHVDEIEEGVRELVPKPDTSAEAAAPTPVAVAATLSPPVDGIRTVRADITEMDTVLDGISETHALLTGLRAAPRKLEQAEHLATLLLDQLAPADARGRSRQPVISQERAHATVQDLRKDLNSIRSQVDSLIDQMDRELLQLRDATEQLRLVPAESLFVSLERTVRDAARALGKNVAFVGAGGDIRLDAYVLGLVQGALVQIIRNAVAHGIEPEDARRAAGKPPAGRVALNVSRRGRHIVFTCSDDGRGVDIDAVRSVAIQRGLLGADAQAQDGDGLIQLLMRGGLSTSATVTEVSGRGVGLDVVRDSIKQLGGNVLVQNNPGRGVTFELVVPLSVASLDVLVVEVAGNMMTIPMDAVRSVIRVSATDVSWGADGGSLIYDKTAIAFVSLPQALFGLRAQRDKTWSALVVAAAGKLVAVGVDRLVDTSRVVVRPLPEFVPAHAMIAGASLDAEGNPQLVLDPDGIVAGGGQGLAPSLEQSGPARPILVIDDSLTTRMLERSILEAAGYEVDTATSGEEGLACARRKRYALILVDVEMPGMDGFTFIERTRADPALHDIPAILVTSRGSPEDMQRGREVGAHGHIIKSEFDQAKLIAMIRPLTS